MRAQIDENAAFDRIVTAFADRGWHDSGKAARRIVTAALGGIAESRALAASVPRSFLVNNSINRIEVISAIEAALGSHLVVVAARVEPSVTNVNVTNSGNFTGNIGSGNIRGTRQTQQIAGDEVVRNLVDHYRRVPEVREITGSDLPAQTKRRQLKAFLKQAGQKGLEVGEDVAAKVVTGLIRGS